MNCSSIRRKINLYIDERLDPEDKSLFEVHLNQCHSCAQEYAKASAIVTATREIISEDVPENFSADLKIKLAEVNRGNAIRIPDFFKKPVFKAVAASVAALLVIFIAGGIIRNSSDLFNRTSSMNAALEDSAQPGDFLKSSEETFAATALGAQRVGVNTIITILAEKPEEQLDSFKLFAEGYGAIQLDPNMASDGTETDVEQQVSAGSTFSIPKDVYDIIINYLRDKYPAANIDLQEISLPGETESSISISITFNN